MFIESKGIGSRIFDLFNYILLGFLAFICLYPMLHVFWGSISDPMEFAVHRGTLLWPQGFSLEGYKIVFRNPNIWSGYRNTLFYVVVGTIIKLFMTSLGAYVLSRKGFMFRKHLTFMLVFTMYFSGGLIPTFLLVQALGLYNTRWAIILPALIATWNLLILRTAFQSIPASLRESAELDGANDLVILMRIVIPVSKATIAVIAMYYAVGERNAWFNAMVFLRDRKKFPLQLVLREILMANSDSGNLSGHMMEEGSIELFIEEIIRYCTIIVSTLPILCIYPFIQKYSVRGVMMGSLKE